MGKITYLKDKSGNSYMYDDGNIIGRGGTGIVFLGKKKDSNGVEELVAIKEIGVQTNETIERAQRESQIQLNHENLVRMFAFVKTEENNNGFVYSNYYVISEYLEGVILDDILRGEIANKDGFVFPAIEKFYARYIKDREDLSKEVIKAILSGVMALHDKGYIHRDIDPTNIMITSNGGIKLIDFGIAKKLSEVSSMEKKLTTPGAFVGKPEYAAPELITGDVENQGYATDVYTIGILYYQLLTGHMPFEGTKQEILKQHLNSNISLKEITSKPTRRIIKKATEKDYNNRYSSCAEFRADIDNPKTSFNPKPIVISFGVVLLITLFALLGNHYKNKDISQINNTEKLTIVNTDSIDYEQVAPLMNSEIYDSLTCGLSKMKALAEKGNKYALFEVAKTYAWIPNDIESDRRKRLMGWEIIADGALKGAPASEEINREAINWLQKSIDIQVPNYQQAIYWLAFYYYFGLATKEDIAKAIEMLELAKVESEKNQDLIFKEKIEKTLNQLNKKK